MKKPEEIKKGLECCTNDSYVCDEKCPYFGTDCAAKMHVEVLAYIQQLETSYSQVGKALCGKKNATLNEVLQAVSQVKAELADAKINHQHTIDIAERQKKQINKLKKLVVKINRERRELEEIFRIYPAVCVVCKNYEEGSCKSEPNKYGTCFEWRGACPENTEKPREE